MNLEAKLKALVAEMQTIVDGAKAQNRDLTASEAATIESNAERARALRDKIERVKKSEAALAALVDFGAGTDDNPNAVKYLALTGSAAKTASRSIHTAIHAEHGQKAFLAPGTITVDVPLTDTTPVELKRVPTSLLDLLRIRVRENPMWRGLRQSGFTNNASIVPAGATKPTSLIEIESVVGHLNVIAHLSEPVDKYLLVDNESLMSFIAGNLLWGLALTLEEEILNGDGSAFVVDGVNTAHFTGILNTTGVQQQTFLTDRVTTLRAAATKLETIGFNTDAYVLNPADWEAIETSRNVSGQFDLGTAVNRAERLLWGTPVVTSTRVTAGEALALDLDSMNVDIDQQGIEIRWDGSGPLFDKNQVKARVEGRFGFSIERPEGIVVADLTAA